MTETLGRWRQVRLGDCAEIVAGYAFKSKQFTDDPNDIHLIKGADVQQGYVNWDGCKHWPKEDAANYSKFRLVEGDVILAMDRPWVPAGLKWAWIKSGAPEALLVQRVSRLRGNNGLLTDYLRYLIASRVFEDYIRPIVTGLNVPHISGKQIADFSFRLPDLSTQGRIAAILSAYDDLIENNLRRIQILEEMAQNLYREWFVKFRFSGHEQVRMVDSPLGKIPEGWEVAPLGQYLSGLQSGKRPKGGVGDLTSGIPSIGAENVVGIGVHNYQNEKFVSRDFFQAMRKGVAQDGDVALYKDGAYIGRSTYFRDGFPHAEFCVNEHVFLLRSTGSRLTQNALYLWLKEDNTVSAIRGTNANAAQPGINQKGVKGLLFVVPSEEIASRFDELVNPYLALIVSLAKRNNALRKSRDLLLPKLISGELDVSSLPIAVPEEAA